MIRALSSPSARAVRRGQDRCSTIYNARECCFEQLERRTLLSVGVLPTAGDLAPAAVAQTPFLAYLKLDNIQGDSQDANHVGWITVLGYSESVSHPGVPIAGGLLVGRSALGDFEIVKAVDKTSPTLFQDAVSGKDLQSAVLEIVEPGVAIVDYKLTDPTISGISDAGAGNSSLPLEQVSLNFTKVEWDYTPLNADGSPGTTVSESWNAGAMTPFQPGAAAVNLPAVQFPGNGAQLEAFLKLDGVDGASQDVNHQDWIDVLSYSEGLSQGGFRFTSGSEAGKVSYSDFSVSTLADKTTPILFQDAAGGKHIASGILEVVEPDGGYLDYELTDVLISGVSDEGSAGDAAPLEQITLNFSKIEWSYTPPAPVTTVADAASQSSSAPAAAASPAFMAFLKLGSVDGLSQDANHKDWIDVLSYSEGVSSAASLTIGSATGGAEAGKVTFSDLSVSTYVDKTTPILFQYAASGKHFPSAVLEVVKPNGTYLDYKLSDVLISGLSDKGSAGDSLPQEQITLNFSKIEWDYTPLNADGSPGTPVSAIWNLRGSAEPPDPALAALAAPPSTGNTPFLAYLKLDGVDGESQDANHKDWIDVLSYSEGVSSAAPLTIGSATGGAGAGRAAFSDLTVLTPIDKATPILFQDSLSGQEIKYATLEVVEPGGAYLDYKLTDVLISSVSDKGSAGDSLPQEQITLNFTKIEWDYTPLNADGSPGTPVSAIWNLRGSAEPPDPALAALAAPPSAGSTPFLAYLKLDGVDGESQDVNHKDWIDVFSYSEGVSLPLSVGSFTGGLEAGKVKFSDLTVLTAADQTTPILFQDSISGTEIKYAVLEVVEPNGEYLDYKLSDVLITSVSDKGNAGDSAPLEQVSLNFTKIEWDYTPLNADGSPGTPVSASWELPANSFGRNATAATLTTPPPSAGSTPFLAYLKLDGVDGSSQDTNHKDWIEILSYSLGASQAAPLTIGSATGGIGAGKTMFSELTVSTDVDKSTPTLFLDAVSGHAIKYGVLEVVESGGAVLDYKLSNVTITAVSDQGNAADSPPVEQISLNFTKIEWDYTPPSNSSNPTVSTSADASLAVFAPWIAGGGGSGAYGAVDTLFGDPKLDWLKYLPVTT